LIRFADRVRAISSTGIDLLGLPGVALPVGLADHLRSFDSIVSWYGTNRPEFRAAVRDLPFQLLPALPGQESHLHAADFFLRQVGGSGGAIPRIDVEPAERGDVVAIHPFSGSARKNWPLERFRELAARLDWPVEWIAGPDEELAGAKRFDSLGDLANWLATARSYIGNDSGITHLAAAIETPVVAIFGPTSPEVWGPRGTRVQVVHGNLEEMRVEDVLAVVDWLQ